MPAPVRIDIHCHVLNARSVEVAEFLGARILPNTPASLVPLVKKDAPTRGKLGLREYPCLARFGDVGRRDAR
jgi:hypothetical protein